MERDRSRVRTTAAGQALLRPAREVLQAERNARMAVHELSGLLRGVLRVGGSTIPASYLLPGLFAAFHEAHPGVTLRLVTGDSRDVVERVRNADVEVGIVGAPPQDRDLESVEVGKDRLVLIASPDHPLVAKGTASGADLKNHAVVTREEGSGTRAAAEDALAKLGADVVRGLRVACEVGSTEAVKAAVRAGMGIAFVSDLSVKDELAHGTLAIVKVRGFDVSRSFHLVTRPEALLGPAARAFRDVALRA